MHFVIRSQPLVIASQPRAEKQSPTIMRLLHRAWSSDQAGSSTYDMLKRLINYPLDISNVSLSLRRRDAKYIT